MELTQQHLDAIINTSVAVTELKVDVGELKTDMKGVKETLNTHTNALDSIFKTVTNHDIEWQY